MDALAVPSNPFFGVGPISDGSCDAQDMADKRAAFETWLTETYRKQDATGRDIGGYSAAELALSMHRGEPADSILRDMMRTIHGYFGFPASNRMAVGLGGGHTGFTVAVQHLMTLHDPAQQVFVDTPMPETPAAATCGFFRQSWATQIIEMCALARDGSTDALHFASSDGAIPDRAELERRGIRLFIGVGHETTGASTYTTAQMRGLLDWLAGDPENRHAILDATSLLGAMPWSEAMNAEVLARCCVFMPLQKAIGGVAGYWVASFTPQALAQIERNLQRPSWAIPRQQCLAVPTDPSRPLSGGRSVANGPFYDPVADRMTGGVINTYSLLAFAETTFALRRQRERIGPVEVLNARSMANRQRIEDWVASEPLFDFAVPEPERRGAAVTLLRVIDPEAGPHHARILAKAKQLLGHEGLVDQAGHHHPGLNAARYVNAFPGMPGDFRAWIGGIRPPEDIDALLSAFKFAWLEARTAVLAEG
ncbi:hypothetical protein [Roseovarius sp.]|mgnify:CR=1 FL=1|uniref:hypothetical protein n=1 Tax=Roseovarius sp. TaxID=1486281 RepID=UPI000C5CC227|nr:hypothetical protein [Roseovarius sp.]MAZ20985.1 hypothetical protein [Roseovarius sp.]